MKKTRYVLGFAFAKNNDKEYCVFVEKKRAPDAAPTMKGFFNAVGGKIEPTDFDPQWQTVSPLMAMTREFYEETGISVPEQFWSPCGILHNDFCQVHVFWTMLDWHLTFNALDMHNMAGTRNDPDNFEEVWLCRTDIDQHLWYDNVEPIISLINLIRRKRLEFFDITLTSS